MLPKRTLDIGLCFSGLLTRGEKGKSPLPVHHLPSTSSVSLDIETRDARNSVPA
jgi:hypothetical protein